jgi:hypothetical protein
MSSDHIVAGLLPSHISLAEASLYRVFRAQADWTFILPSELSVKELRYLLRKMRPRSTTYREALWTSDKPAQ